MALDHKRLQQLTADDDIVIDTPLHCGACGYLLKMLPYRGRSPECGNDYDARSHHMKGIFVPQTAEFPAFDIVAAGACTLLEVWLIGNLVMELDLWGMFFTGVFGYLSVVFLKRAWIGLGRFIRGQRMADRLEQGEE